MTRGASTDPEAGPPTSVRERAQEIIFRNDTPAGKPDRECPRCGLDDHDADARYCKQCGDRIPSLELETA